MDDSQDEKTRAKVSHHVWDAPSYNCCPPAVLSTLNPIFHLSAVKLQLKILNRCKDMNFGFDWLCSTIIMSQ